MRGVALVGFIATCLTSCASDYQQVLHEVRPLSILNRVPPGGAELARAEDKGTIAGDQPGVAVVYASSRSPAEVNRYYLSHYPEYSLRHDSSADFGAAPPLYAEIGTFRTGNVEATVSVRIQLNSPDLSQQGINYGLKPKTAPRGAKTFVTVNVFGFVSRDTRSS